MTEQQLIDPRPMEPAEVFDIDPPEPVIEKELYDGHLGRYIPQFFCQDYDWKPCVAHEYWEICKQGPEHNDYDEAWSDILFNYEYERSDHKGKYRYYLEYSDSDGSLNLMKAVVHIYDEDGNVAFNYE